MALIAFKILQTKADENLKKVFSVFFANEKNK